MRQIFVFVHVPREGGEKAEGGGGARWGLAKYPLIVRAYLTILCLIFYGFSTFSPSADAFFSLAKVAQKKNH